MLCVFWINDRAYVHISVLSFPWNFSITVVTMQPYFRRFSLRPGLPFTNMVLTLIPAVISNYIHYKLWDETTYPFLNFGMDK